MHCKLQFYFCLLTSKGVPDLCLAPKMLFCLLSLVALLSASAQDAAETQQAYVVNEDGSLTSLSPHDCPNRVNSHIDAGHEGIEEGECLDIGACWDPTSPGPWCYPLGERMRTIVQYTADDRINTAVWSEYGGAPPQRAELRWGNTGVVVEKTCPVACHFTSDQAALATADAVLIEAVNFESFGVWEGHLPLPEASRPHPLAAVQSTLSPQLPLLGLFGMEPADHAPHLSLGGEHTGDFHFSVTHNADSTLPVTLVCPWGQPVSHFLAPPPAKDPAHFMAYFSEHGVSAEHSALVEGLLAAAAAAAAPGPRIHAYSYLANTPLPAGLEANLPARLAHIANFSYLLITTPSTERDFISPELSHALQAGTVPVYLGAENVADYMPPRGWVDARAFGSGAELWKHLTSMRDSEAFFAWKQGARSAAASEAERLGGGILLGTGQGLDPNACEEGRQQDALPGSPEFGQAAAAWWRCFRKHLDRCVYYAECAICKFVTENT